MSSALSPLIADIKAAVQAGDDARFRRCLARLHAAGQSARADDLTRALDDMASWLCALNGLFAKAALVAGAFVEWGGSPLPLAAAVPGWTAYKMQLYALFLDVWPGASGGRPLPDREDPSAMRSVAEVMSTAAERARLPATGMAQIAATWFDLEDWLKLMITLMAQREFRAAMADRDKVRDSAAAIAGALQSAGWVHGLSVVLDGEPLVALDHASRRGFHLTMTGIGDNFQLHTLLADRLSGHGRHGPFGLEPPKPGWVAAATDAPPQLPSTDPVLRRFRLFDGLGCYVLPEGRPADIAPLDGTRVVVLHAPLGRYGWSGGRTYQNMMPTLTLDRLMEPAESADWLARVYPARENDFMSISNKSGPRGPRRSG
jgi:hypothetical protein